MELKLTNIVQLQELFTNGYAPEAYMENLTIGISSQMRYKPHN
jgi:hypothetical protein